ncbi:MAG TPA: DUF882 domain-containing protein [Polyangiaceae bacterium]|nr:DUF882 domain-containing protein [Polyangiaceae bacterium]
MKSARGESGRKAGASRLVAAARWVLGAIALFVARDAPAHTPPAVHAAFEAVLAAAPPAPRVAAWAHALPPVEVTAPNRAKAAIRLYADDGEVDPEARAILERIAAGDGSPHELAARVEQLLVRAAYHFGDAQVFVVSAYRERASRHGTGEAIDFKLKGVTARALAAYLRALPRVGVGVYTNPRTQFVHLDVRDQSYHWLDASPPGIRWREGALRDPGAEKRDAAWTPQMDLPQ